MLQNHFSDSAEEPAQQVLVLSNIMARLALRQETSTIELLSCNVEIKGFEPSTYGLQSRRSSHLSYIPAQRYLFRIEALRPKCATFKKKGQEGKAACT